MRKKPLKPSLNVTALRNAEKSIALATSNSICPSCSRSAQVLHELWIPKSAVMAADIEKRRAINHPINMAFICNQCNVEMTHAKEVTIRRHHLITVAQRRLFELGLPSLDISDFALTIVGMVFTQVWLDGMHMRTRYEAWRLAELWQMNIPNPLTSFM